jgi:YD repeat-containing protein
VTTYTRDPESRITLIALPDETVQTMTYDATGMRRKKQTADATTASP